SILLTLFMFRETLPPEKRAAQRAQRNGLHLLVSVLKNSQINLLLALMFAQQIVFFAFESLLGLFVLTRLGLLGEGSSLVFIVVGVTLVTVQARYMGRLSQKFGERRLVFIALGLLAVGLILLAFTPEQPQPFYIRQVAEHTLRSQAVSTANATSG